MGVKPALPEAIVAAVGPDLPALADEIVEAIRAEVPEYARPLSGAFGTGIRTGVEDALSRFAAGGEGLPDVYRALGRGELRAGRSLDALQSAYRVGARIAWRRLSRVAAEAGVPVAEQHALAEAIFAYIDAIAGESVEGYAEAQAAEAGDRQRRREALLARLATGPPGGGEDFEEASLRAAAAQAAWPLPRRLVFLACAGDPGRLARRLSGDVLHGRVGEQPCVVVGDPGTLDAEVAAAAQRLGLRIGVGPLVAPGEAPRSWQWATRALALGPPGTPTVVPAEEHLAQLVMAGSPELLAALRERVLAPLASETPASRARLEATLAAWLDRAGARAAVAADLGVHPQTVRYRVGRLREIFGAGLDDPATRFELMLAVRAPPPP